MEISFGCALLAIAGVDGKLAEEELQWFIDEQEIMNGITYKNKI